MKLLFIDESFSQKNDFVILGIIIDSTMLINLEKQLSAFRVKNLGGENLKFLRTTRSIARDTKLKLSQELYSSLKPFSIKLISVVLGTWSATRRTHIDQYCEAMRFMIERFFFYLHQNNDLGIIIIDSNQNSAQKEIRNKANQYILETTKREGKIRSRIYAPVFFCEDSYSNLIQLSDLMCAGIQNATFEYLKNNKEESLKKNEEALFQCNPFMSLYKEYFLTFRDNISGAGIKFWS
jgi:hypothetical protein